MFITFRSRFPFLKSERWRRKFFAMGPYIPWILRPPCVSMDQKLEEVGKRYSRNDFIPQESSWPITREEKNVVRPWIVENHPKSGAIPFLFLFFLPSLSLHRATLCATLPLLSALGSNLVLHRNATSWTWLVFKEAGGIHQTGPPGFHRASESFSSQLGSFRFLLLGKDLARSCSVLRERWSFLRSKKGFKFVVFVFKNDDYNEFDRQSLDRAIGKDNKILPSP